MIRRLLTPLASLRLTVTLLAMAMVLIFVGTIVQTRLGVWQAVDTYFRSWIAMIDPALIVSGEPGRWRVPFPGGLTIAAAMIANLLAAHSVRFKAARKRIGVLVLHAGLIVLLAGEFVTGFMADEGLMSIDEGSSSSIVEDVRAVELAVIDPGDLDSDRIITIPGWMLAQAASTGETITDPRLPFALRIDAWMANSALFHAHEPTRATEGIGLEARAEPQPRVTGVEGARSDTPAAYITLIRGNSEIGTWMVSAALTDPQNASVENTTYGVALRYRRTYLPFTLHLEDFRHDTFTGTSIAKNFSSDVRIIDPARNTDREARIWMNNPLRYGGRTFYQASYKPDGSGTVLQVVRNPGWLMPYAACVLVGAGMTWHFARSLVAFLRRRIEHGPISTDGTTRAKRRVWPWLVGTAAVLIACSAALRSEPVSGLDVRSFATLPVSAGGRIKPMDSAARSMLMVAGGRQSIETDEGTTPAASYLLDLISDPARVSGLPVVRVDHPGVLDLLGLAPEDGGRIALSAIEPYWADVADQARRAADVRPQDRDGFQKAALQLHDRVNTILAHAQMREPYTIPPLSPDGAWRPFHEAFLDARGGQEDPHPSVAFLTSMMTAANDGDTEGFNAAVEGYTQLLDASMPGVMRRMRLEVLFNRTAPFAGAAAVYVLAFVGVCFSFVARSRSGPGLLAGRLRVAAFALLVGAVLVHTAAIALRVHLQGRPPVTNLYSSAVFVGWAAALAGIFMERLFPLGVAILGSAAIGAGTLIVAHNLGNDGDTMQMMQAVLDSNFWLATHVITVTLGYSATFLAGAIASVFLLARVFTRAVTPERGRAMIRMVYGVVCFALLLSFVGTVLGGIWADQSWGRFWGWDPKENGAALVVLINAIILHARWGGLVRARGIAALAVAGNIVTAWSWFGTNMLGVGLHAYGFMESASFWLAVFVGSQLVIIALAAAPDRASDKTRHA